MKWTLMIHIGHLLVHVFSKHCRATRCHSFSNIIKDKYRPHLRVAMTHQGPTLSFKIHECSLAFYMNWLQARPRCPWELFKSPPLIIFCGI